MSEIEFSVDSEGIGLLRVNRPQVRNALNWKAQQAFAEVIHQASQNTDLKAFLITGTEGAFMAGGDLKELNHHPSREDGERLASIMGDALNELEKLPVITIAVINGPARGGGSEVAVTCDLRVMSDQATIAFVHARLGLIPGWGGGERLLRLVGYGRAIDLITTTRVVNAQEAVQIGLVNRVIPTENLLEEAYEIARQIIRNHPQSITAYKQLFRQYGELSPQEARKLERDKFVALWDTETRREAFRKANQS